MRDRMDVTQLAVLDAEEVRIGRTAAAGCVSGAEGAERDDSADCRVHHEAAVRDVHTARDADVTAVIRGSFAGMHAAAFRAVAGVAPRHQILFLFKKRIEIGIGGSDQRVARIALVGGNGVPLLSGRILFVGVGAESPITRRGPDDFDLGDLVVVDAQARAENVGMFLVSSRSPR